MVKKLLTFLSQETKGLHQAAYLMAGFTFLSQILALLRDRLFAYAFGAGSTLDLYYASFRIPDVLFVTVASLVSVSVLVPFFARTQDANRARTSIDSLFTVFFGFMIVTIGIVAWYMPELTKLFLPGVTDPALVPMSRVLLLSPLILGISNLCGGIVQSRRRFLAYAMSPVLYNVGIIAGLVCFYKPYGLLGLMYGVVLGAILHLGIQIPTLIREHVLPRFTLKIQWVEIKDIFLLSIPRTLTLANTQLIMFFSVSLASLFAVGSISIFTFAYNLQSVPLAIIGVSYSLAAFPTLSRLWHNKDVPAFRKELWTTVKHILFWSIPIMVLFVVLRAQIVRTILGSGQFSWQDTRLTAASLALFALSVAAQNITLVFIRALYAMGETTKPLLYAIIGLLGSAIAIYVELTTGAGAWLLQSIAVFLKVSDIKHIQVLILPLAFSVGEIVEVVFLWWYLRHRCGFEGGVWKSVWESILASGVVGYLTYISTNFFVAFLDINTFWGIFLQGLLSGSVGILAGGIVLWMIGNIEIRVVCATLHSKIWKSKAKLITESKEDLL